MSRQTAEQRRDTLRSAAYQCFRDRGYHESSVDDICTAAGISKGSFYWSYESKQAVLVDIIETWTQQVMDTLYEQFQAAVEAPDYVDAIIQALTRETRRGRVIVPVWTQSIALSGREPRIKAAVEHFHRRLRMAIATMLRPALNSRMDEAAIQGVAAGVLGVYLGLIMQDHVDREGSDADVVLAAIMGVLRPWLAIGLPEKGPGDPEQGA